MFPCRNLLALFGMLIFVFSGPRMLLADEVATDSPEELPLERRPYQVRLLVACDSRAFDSAATQVMLRDLDQAAKRTVGDLWQLTIMPIDWLKPTNAMGLGRLEYSRIAQEFPGETPDIVMVSALESLAIGSRVCARSWQPEMKLQTEVESVEVIDRREIAMSLLRLCRALARPMGLVEQVTDKSVRIRLRAGEINAPDPSFVQLREGDVLQPLMAFRGKRGTVDRLQSIPWTYLTVDDIFGSTVNASVQSGLRVALGGKKRGRIDTLVVALRPQHSTTQIELLTQSKPPRPLVAHRIEVRSEPVVPKASDAAPDIDPNSTLLGELLTDRRGQATVSDVGQRRLVWLFAYSGQNLLARVPLVPGLNEKAPLEVPDDAARLAAEADLQMLQTEVIDAVALRNTAIATMRAAAKKEDWATVHQKLDTIRRQQDVAAFGDRVTAVRVRGIAAAKSRKDKTAETRINRMCDELKTLIAVHLSDDKVAAVAEEMESLEHADKDREEKPAANR